MYETLMELNSLTRNDNYLSAFVGRGSPRVA